MDEDKKGKQADLLEDEKPGNHHAIPRKRGEMRISVHHEPRGWLTKLEIVQRRRPKQ